MAKKFTKREKQVLLSALKIAAETSLERAEYQKNKPAKSALTEMAINFMIMRDIIKKQH